MPPVDAVDPPWLVEARRAMWSVHFATASDLDERDLMEPLRPIRLDRALDVITAGMDGHAAERRRRALTKLTKSGLHRSLRGTPAFDRLVESLPVGRAFLRHDDPKRAVGQLNARLQRRAGDEGCVTSVTEHEIRHDPKTRVSTLQATVRINRPLATLRPVIDPRVWDDCTEFFRETYACRLDDYSLPDETVTEEQTSWNGYLFEVFDVDQARFENVLEIDYSARPRQNRIVLNYAQYDNPVFTFLGMRRAGVIEVDDGTVIAEPDRQNGERSIITVTKHVAFGDLTPNLLGDPVDYGQWLSYTTPAALGAWIERPGLMWACCRLQGQAPPRPPVRRARKKR